MPLFTLKKTLGAFLGVFIFISGCSHENKEISYSSETLKVEQLSKNIYRHISYLQTEDYGKVGCNGMIYFNKNEAIVYDTPTKNSVSLELINWIENNQEKEIKAIVATHFHGDCLGGLKAFHDKKIPSYASNKTITLAKPNNKVLPENGFDNQIEIKIGNETTIAKFYGEGHTKDNVIGYIPTEKAIFGGCLVKEINAPKGYLGDANIDEWPETVATIKREIPDIEIVIPGHGKTGDTALLDYTITLFKEK